jgi:negative regulator of flagellin synthesis FlgM
MSISQLNGQERLRATAAAAALRKTAASPTATPSVTRQPDEVSISAAGRSMAATRTTTASEVAETRDDKINALKAAIANGSYTVDSQRLARSMFTRLTS